MNARFGLSAALIASLLSTAGAALAEESEYLPRGQAVTGLYGAPEIKASTLAGDGVVLAGAEAGWILAHSLVVAGAGYTTLTNVVSPTSLQSPAGDAHLGISYGGVRAAVLFDDHWRVHGRFGVLVGGGTAWSENRTTTYHSFAGYLVIEPDLQLEANLTDHVRIALGAGYRFAADADAPGFSMQRLSGPVGLASVRLGQF